MADGDRARWPTATGCDGTAIYTERPEVRTSELARSASEGSSEWNKRFRDCIKRGPISATKIFGRRKQNMLADYILSATTFGRRFFFIRARIFPPHFISDQTWSLIMFHSRGTFFFRDQIWSPIWKFRRQNIWLIISDQLWSLINFISAGKSSKKYQRPKFGRW